MNEDGQLRYRVFGMDCAEEVAALKRELTPIVGDQERLGFDLIQGKLTVRVADSAISSEAVEAGIRRAGLRSEVWNDDVAATAVEPGRSPRALLVGVSGASVVIGFAIQTLAQESIATAAARAAYAAAILAGVWLVIPKAWNAARRFRPDMNLLMVIAVLGAIAIGEWLEGATVAFLFALSNLLESWSIGRARRAIASLLDLAPPLVSVRQANGAETQLPPEQVQLGTVFLVRPGERIPLDGRIISGASGVNQAPITGESRPIDKYPGDTVFAGSINGDGALRVESTSAANQTMLAGIIRLVEEAQSRRANAEQWVERFARLYTPGVLIVSFGAFLIPPLVFGTAWMTAIYNALVLLVIACPCALVISTPVSIVAGLTAAANRGVLIKGGVFLEIPAKLSAIAFDKTGTLTLGKPSVDAAVPLSGHSEAELLERAAAMEANSDHPLARAIVAYADGKGIRPAAAEDLKTIQGKGAAATFAGQPYWIGSHKYLEERGQETPAIHDQLTELSSSGRSVVVVGNDRHVCGFLTLADTVRPQAKDALARLRAVGIVHLVLLTGDNKPTAEALAAQVGIDEIHAELLPQAKVAQVERLVEKYKSVAMVGDGINDAPALATATLGISMGAAGSDAAIETADIALLGDDLNQLPWLVKHSRRSLAIIRQNIVFSLAVKGVFVALTLFGLSSLWSAIAADTGASLLVVCNGLRLLHDSPLLGRFRWWR